MYFMPPKFTTNHVWNQADRLMQPSLIRLLDNLRKESESQNWEAVYDNQLRWPEGTMEDQKAEYDRLQSLLHDADDESVLAIESNLALLPQPLPHYGLCLSQGDRSATFDIWELCYQICFEGYCEEVPVTIDGMLFDDQDELDWDRLEQKTRAIVLDLFANLLG
jgi:hypothetical protein